MRNKLYISFTFLLYVICLTPLKLASQNKYQVKVIQPDSLTSPIIKYISTSKENNNIIVWDLPTSKLYSSTGVYRESLKYPSKWDLIGKTTTMTSNQFIDQASIPEIQAYRYRLSAFDQCGNETLLSQEHRSIKLRVVKINSLDHLLTWNTFEGCNINTFRIYKGTDPDDLQLIDSVSSNQYYDNIISSDHEDAFYRVDAVFESKNTDPKAAQFLLYASSNITSGLSLTGIKDTTIKKGLQIYPNPSSVQTTLFFPNPLGKSYKVTIVDITGKSVFFKAISTSQVEVYIGNLKDGIYMVRVKGEQTFGGKMVVKNIF